MVGKLMGHVSVKEEGGGSKTTIKRTIIMTATSGRNDSNNRKDKKAGFQKWKVARFTNNPSWLFHRFLNTKITQRWAPFTCLKTSCRSRTFDLVEYSTFLITSLASSKVSLLRSGLTPTASLAPGEPGSLLSVDDIDTTDWLTFGDMGTA